MSSRWERVLQRPPGYQKMSERERWEIDKKLDILDWDGSCPHNPGYPCNDCENEYFSKQQMGQEDE